LIKKDLRQRRGAIFVSCWLSKRYPPL